MLTDSNSPKELLEQALDTLNKEHQRRLQNQGSSYGHDRYQKRAEKKIADYENAILILSKKEVNFFSSKPAVIKSVCECGEQSTRNTTRLGDFCNLCHKRRS